MESTPNWTIHLPKLAWHGARAVPNAPNWTVCPLEHAGHGVQTVPSTLNRIVRQPKTAINPEKDRPSTRTCTLL